MHDTIIQALNQTIHDKIQITELMGITVTAYTGRELTIEAPIATNKNDKNTAFAGSIYSTAVLCGWALISQALSDTGIEARVMVINANITYKKAITGDLCFTSKLPSPSVWTMFINDLNQKKKNTLSMTVVMCVDGELYVSLVADYFVKIIGDS